MNLDLHQIKQNKDEKVIINSEYFQQENDNEDENVGQYTNIIEQDIINIDDDDDDSTTENSDNTEVVDEQEQTKKMIENIVKQNEQKNYNSKKNSHIDTFINSILNQNNKSLSIPNSNVHVHPPRVKTERLQYQDTIQPKHTLRLRKKKNENNNQGKQCHFAVLRNHL